MSWRHDPELDDLFPDPEERRLAAILSAVQAPRAEPDPAFRSQLRRQLMTEGWGRADRLPWWRRLTAPAPAAWGMATVGTILIAAAVFFSMHPGGGAQTVFVSYDLNLAQPVAAVRPLDVTFSQPMDRSSVEQAFQIQPATSVTYSWVSDREVKITPASGSFAPNTQYTVALAPGTARSQSGSVVAEAKPAVFTVAPVPTPAATPTPSPTPVPAPLNTHPLGPAGPVRPAWISPTSVLYVGATGQLVQQATDGKDATVLLPQPVQAVVARPDGTAALVSIAGAVSELNLATRTLAPVPAPAPVLAFGYDATGKPSLVTAGTAGAAGGTPHRLEVAATAAWLSPHAAALVYAGAQGLRGVDLATGRETAWPAPSPAAILAWSPDDKRVLYAAADGLHSADPSGGAPALVSAETGVTSADWSPAGGIAFTAPSGLWSVAADGTGARRLAEGTGLAGVSWSVAPSALTYFTPAAGGAGGSVLNLGVLTAPPSTSGPARLGADEAARTLSSFMQARVAGQADPARALLDPAGVAAYDAAGTLLYSGVPRLQRWFTVAVLPGPAGVTFDTRLVLADAQGRDVAQLDELVTVARDGSGRALVHGARIGAQRAYGKGPEVLAVQASHAGVRLQFDSDLASGAGDAVQLTDGTGRKQAAGTLSGTREVVLTPAAALAPGTYRLTVPTALRDRDGRPALSELDLDLVFD